MRLWGVGSWGVKRRRRRGAEWISGSVYKVGGAGLEVERTRQGCVVVSIRVLDIIHEIPES